jgi:hypothetical protein
MKILFLDIDGVLNCATTKERIGGDGIFAAMIGLDARPVMRLRRWLERHPEVKVVLSSTWRLHPDTLELVQAALPIFDVTPNLDNRQREIQAWLVNRLEIEPYTYAILDDMQFFRGEVARHFVQTSYQHGLLEQHLMRVEKILGLSACVNTSVS